MKITNLCGAIGGKVYLGIDTVIPLKDKKTTPRVRIIFGIYIS